MDSLFNEFPFVCSFLISHFPFLIFTILPHENGIQVEKSSNFQMKVAAKLYIILIIPKP